MKRFSAVILSVLVIITAFAGCSKKDAPPASVEIVLSDSGVTVGGEKASSDKTKAVYVANDIIFYEEGHDFT